MEKVQLRISAACAYYESQHGKKIDKELAAELWPSSKPDTRKVNLSNLKSGRTRPNPEQISIICDMTGVDPNFIYGPKYKSNVYR